MKLQIFISYCICLCLILTSFSYTAYADTANSQENQNLTEQQKSNNNTQPTTSAESESAQPTTVKQTETKSTKTENAVNNTNKESNTNNTTNNKDSNDKKTTSTNAKKDNSNVNKSSAENSAKDNETDNDEDEDKNDESTSSNNRKSVPDYSGYSKYNEYNSSNNDTSAYKKELKYFDSLLGTVLRYPLANQARISTYFGSVDSVHSHPHAGVDFAISSGTPILAAESGYVIRASWFSGYGNCVDIKHLDGSITRYGHMSEINVLVNDKVLRGQQIGKVGSTGRSTGPHLHFEYYSSESDKPSNPLTLLNAVSKKQNYINAKLTFVNNNTNITSLKNLKNEDIYFQLNEHIKPVINNGKTIIGLGKFIDSGLIEDLNEVKIFSKKNYNIKVENKHIILDKEVVFDDIQILIPCNSLSDKAVPVYLTSDIENVESKDSLIEFNPLFNMEIEVLAQNLNKGNFIIHINGKRLSDTQYEYKSNKLVLYYSCLNVNDIRIHISEKSRKVLKVDETNNINNIISWISSNHIDMIKFNSLIQNCYYVPSIINSSISNKPSAYNKYNNTTYENMILLDNYSSDGFISIPKNIGFSKINFLPNSNTLIDGSNLQINDKEYNIFIYGEKLNILNEVKIKEGYKDVNFNVISMYEDDKYNYFVISYEVEGIGGYFGIKIEKDTSTH